MITKDEKIAQFNPSGVGLKNGNFIGLPFEEEDAAMVVVPVPFDVTVSYADGTATAATNILEASSQLDLYDTDLPDAWKMGLYVRPIADEAETWLKKSQEMRKKAKKYIDFLESGGDLKKNAAQRKNLQAVNETSEALKNWVHDQTEQLLVKGKMVGLVGGEHSIPLGFLEALSARHESFGILQIDAHFDLREAYEGFIYSHASIFYNALKIKNIERIVHVGIRDFCEEEVNLVQNSGGRNVVFYDHDLKNAQYEGEKWADICQRIVNHLPQNVYISFDIDGLKPELCPHTGTPVVGGLEYQEAIYLLRKVVDSGRTIIGFDLSEVAGIGNEWDGNVGARVLYKLANLMAKSQGNATI